VFRNDLAEEPLQVVLKEGIIDFRVEDIRDKDPQEQQYLLNTIAEDSRNKGFDYERQNLFRLIVVNTGDSFELIWQQHHLILDGWSNALLMEEFLNIIRTEKDLQIETSQKSSFSEYIKWLDQYDEKQAAQYWKKYLNGYDAIAKIPEANKPDSEKEYQRAVHKFSLTKEQTHQLNDFVVQNKYTLNRNIRTQCSNRFFFF
jgi:hypothetical protein